MKREGPALFFALVYPTLLAWFYFLLLAEGGGKVNPVQQAAYGVGKGVQFAFPLLFLWWCDRCLPRPGWPRFDRLTVAAGFSLLVLAGMFVFYFGALRGSSLFRGSPERIAEKLREFNLTTLPAYIGLSAFISVLHSFLEEYYWRSLSLCIAVGGFFWAWLYEQTRSIWAAWLSHLLIDAGILVIGYDLLRESLFIGH